MTIAIIYPDVTADFPLFWNWQTDDAYLGEKSFLVEDTDGVEDKKSGLQQTVESECHNCGECEAARLSERFRLRLKSVV